MNGDVIMKKIISVFIACSLILSAFTITSYAYNQKSLEITEFISGYDKFGEGDLPVLSDKVQSYYYPSENVAPIYTAYSLLDDCQKKIYNYIVYSTPGTLSFTFNFEYNEFLSDNFNEPYLSEVMYAVCRDRPEVFYFNSYQVTGGAYYSGYSSIAYINFSIGLKPTSTYTAENLPGLCSDLQNALVNVPVDTSNRYSFVKSVHDYLCTSAYYPDLNSSDYIGNAHDAYGALVEKRTVCEGYSEAFKLICNYYNIPSVCITGKAGGGAHMWNAVQMDDGYWYFLDITWDDQENRIYEDFFLVGLNTKDKYFTGYEFSVSHVSDDLTYLPVLSYASEKYSETEHNTAFKATYNSLAKGNKFLIRSFFDVADCDVYYNGMHVDTQGLTTSSMFTVPSGSSGELQQWSLVLLGDCTGDGECNASDYSDAVNKVLSGCDVTTAFDMAADIDCDGYLDVLDLASIQLLTSGLKTDIEIE